MKNNFLEKKDKTSCYGCNACEYVCPTGAITMARNEQGFLYPIVDEKKCVNCEKCKKVCPYHIDEEGSKGEIYEVAHKNTDVLKRSQSGGAFTAISDFVLKRKGVVYGATFNKDFSVSHSRATTYLERDKMCGSKYVQSIIPTKIFNQIEEDLKNNKWVLFTGTPCQCAMISQIYKKYDRLIVCDFICHGTPSPQVWHDYLNFIRSKFNVQIESVTFRNKRCRMLGNYTESYYSTEGEEILQNNYAALFYSHLAHRENCFSCQFAKEKRYSDITIGGWLEPSCLKVKYDSSMFIVNTDKGKMIFREIMDNLDYKNSELSFYKNQPCLSAPIPKPNQYEEFWNDYQVKDMNNIIRKYATDEIKEKFHIEILNEGKNIYEQN